jgi:hypothetical protein
VAAPLRHSDLLHDVAAVGVLHLRDLALAEIDPVFDGDEVVVGLVLVAALGDP